MIKEDFKKILGGYCYSQDGGNGGYSFDEVWSWLHTQIQKSVNEAIEEKLTEIALNHFDSELGTYDYDGIAEEVLSIQKEI